MVYFLLMIKHLNFKQLYMKRTFGGILTVLGILGIIYGAYAFISHSGETRAVIVAVIVGIIFFLSGISLVRTTKDV